MDFRASGTSVLLDQLALALVRARAHTFDYVGWLLEIAAQLAYFGSITVSTMLDVTLLRDSILGSTKALIRLKTF